MIRQTTLGRSRRTTFPITRLLMGELWPARKCSMFQEERETEECLCLCRFSIGVGGTVYIVQGRICRSAIVTWFEHGTA